MKRLLVVLAGFAPLLAEAQGLSVNLEATADSPISPANVTVAWSSPGAVSCTATGSWSGQKAASGQETVPNVRAPGASFGLNCVGETPDETGSASLSWTPPTQNTDGSPYTNPKGYFIHYGNSPDQLHNPIALFVPTASSYVVEDLVPGAYYFGLRAVSATDVQSELSNVAQKTVTEGVPPTGSATASVEVDTQPNPPEAVAVQ